MKTLMIIAALAAPLAIVAAPAAAAQGDPERLQTTIHYSDLDLGRPAGADAMLGRIKRAAATVCGESYNPVRLGKSKRFHACMRQTMDAAVKQVNAPLVTARYTGPRATVLATK